MFLISCKHQYGKSYWLGATSPLEDGFGSKFRAKKYKTLNDAETDLCEANYWFYDKTQRGLMRNYPNYGPLIVEEDVQFGKYGNVLVEL